jgi:capsular exopolysaccharide synthesis family protein
MSSNTLTDPTLFSAAWRYRWLVAALTAVAVALGIAYVTVFPPETLYSAKASMVVQETGGGLDIGSSGNPQRFVANQVEIINSNAVFQLASDLAEQNDPPVLLEPADLEAGILVGYNNDSDLIDVVFIADEQAVAITGANALAAAYQELVSLETSAAADAALERIDSQLDTLEERVDAIKSDIDAIIAADTARADLLAQYEQALGEIVKLQAEAPLATNTRAAVIEGRLAELRDLIFIYQTVATIGAGSDELDKLRLDEDQVLARREALLERRDQITVDIELAPEVVAFLSTAQTAEVYEEAAGPRIIAVALLLGLLAGVAIAYLLASRRRIFHDRMEPQGVIRVPLLADIPSFAEEGLKTRLPVLDQPRSASAEAFRFAAASLELKMASQQAKSLVVISATLGTGKSTVVANLALAAAREGSRVLLIDADFGNQDLTALLTDEQTSVPHGLTDIVSAGMPFSEAIRSIEIGPDMHLSLLARGRQPVVAADLLRSPKVRQLFDTVREAFDVILVDAPPLLQVAYTSTLASYVDAALVIVAHRGSVGQLEEVNSRLSLIGRDSIGYVYNKSPLRREMTFTEGSMTDILGDMGIPEKTGALKTGVGQSSKKRR